MIYELSAMSLQRYALCAMRYARINHLGMSLLSPCAMLHALCAYQPGKLLNYLRTSPFIYLYMSYLMSGPHF